MEQLNFLREYRPKSGATSMVTLIIPPRYDIASLLQRMKRERQTATNIKNNTNRKSVISAIGGLCEYLKRLKNVPSTGVALFSEQYI